MIRAIIFDCFGVMVTDPWRAFCDSLPHTVDLDRVHELRQKHDAGFMDGEEFYDELALTTTRSQKELQRELTEEYTKNKLLLDYIRELKKTYKIGMISNVSDNWIRDNLLDKEEQKLFDALIFSYEVGTTKPDPRIYEAAIDRLDVEFEECVFVDDIDRYTIAAQDLGMQAVVYRDFHQAKSDLDTILLS